MEVKATIELVLDELVKLRAEDGQLLSLPRTLLPLEIKIGQTIYLQIGEQPPQHINHQNQAKDILNEILDLE